MNTAIQRRFGTRLHRAVLALLVLLALLLPAAVYAGGAQAGADVPDFPPSIDSYGDSHLTSVWDILVHRAKAAPFNVLATALFLAAIIHTGMTHKFRQVAHHLEEEHHAKRHAAESAGVGHTVPLSSGKAKLFHYLGEVEVVFGLWVLPLIVAMKAGIGHAATVAYFHEKVHFIEPIFVVVVMAIASTRPILRLAESTLQNLARLGGSTPAAWWLSILLVGPILGSFITEPAAMTICAMLLSKKFYAHNPSPKLAYGTLGLLFVSVSTGGTLTHFAAPPVLMVAGPWDWDTPHMLATFGWKAIVGILLSTMAYFLLFRGELRAMSGASADADAPAELPIPSWVTITHVALLGLAVTFAHYPVFLVFGLLFFIAFIEVTEEYQKDFSMRSPLLVGFFLAGLVIHGGLQQWWIEPILGNLGAGALYLSAIGLTAFNDNAAITYLCTLVPSFTEEMKYIAVAGAVVGGGLTVIANAPNPAGQSILGKHFKAGISVGGLFLGALIPTVAQGLIFFFLRP